MQDSLLFDKIEQKHGYAFARQIVEKNDLDSLHAVMVRARQAKELAATRLHYVKTFNDPADLFLYWKVQFQGI